MLARYALLKASNLKGRLVEKVTSGAFMLQQQRYAGGPKTGGSRRPRFIPNPKFTGQRPAAPRRHNEKRANEEHWRRFLLDLKGRSRLATSSVAGAQEGADRADRAERADRTREATFSGRLLEEETLHFEELGLDERVTANLSNLRLTRPTPVQQAAIPIILQGNNAAIQSYTGSGKTLAYMLPVLSLAVQRAEEEYAQLMRSGHAAEAGSLQALVLAPSRELAMQIVRVGQSLLPAEARGCVQQAIGGANPVRQVESIRRNKPLIIVGTPGRLAEFSRNGVLLTHQTPILVLDEVDQLLGPQFREDVVRLEQHVGRRLAPGRQTLLVSATLSERVLAQCSGWVPDIVRVKLSAERTIGQEVEANKAAAPTWGWSDYSGGAPGPQAGSGQASGRGAADLIPAMPPQLEHGWVGTSRRHRVDTARRVIHALNAQKALIFMNFQRRLQDTEAKLAASNMPVATLSGELTKVQRQKVLTNFGRGAYRALVVSDLIARGMDIEECDAIVNLELPSDASHYAHRAGRTGRAGRPGTVVSLVEPQERFVMEKLAARLDIEIPELKVVGGKFQYANEAQQEELEEQDWMVAQ